ARLNAAANDSERYREVIAVAHQMLDMMLGRLVELAGSDTTVVVASSFGFCQQPSNASVEVRNLEGNAIGHAYNRQRHHRRRGIVVPAGPTSTFASLPAAVDLRDVCPTVLALLGVPVAQDIGGRAVPQLCPSTSRPAVCDSHEGSQPADGVWPAGVFTDGWYA